MAVLVATGTAPTTTSGAVITSGTSATFPQDYHQIDHDGNAATYVEWTYTGTSQTALRYYVEMPAAWAANSHAIATIRNTSFNICGRGSLGGTTLAGNLRFIDSTGTVVGNPGTGTVANSIWYRVEKQINHATQQARMAIFEIGSTTPIWSSSWTGGSYLAQSDRVQLGATTGAAPVLGSFKIAYVTVSDDITDWIGQYNSDGGTGSPAAVSITVWNGTTLIDAESVGVWNGTELIPVDMEVDA